MYNAIDVAIDCDCDTHVDQSAWLRVIQCIESDEASSRFTSKTISARVLSAHSTRRSQTMSLCQCRSRSVIFSKKQSIIRLLQAFSTYNEVMGYRKDMITTACDCLRIWGGDEDKAFESFFIPLW